MFWRQLIALLIKNFKSLRIYIIISTLAFPLFLMLITSEIWKQTGETQRFRYSKLYSSVQFAGPQKLSGLVAFKEAHDKKAIEQGVPNEFKDLFPALKKIAILYEPNNDPYVEQVISNMRKFEIGSKAESILPIKLSGFSDVGAVISEAQNLIRSEAKGFRNTYVYMLSFRKSPNPLNLTLVDQSLPVYCSSVSGKYCI